MAHPLHPMLVHFPIALLITSVFFDLLGMLVEGKSFYQMGRWLLILGLLGGVVASLAGASAEDAVVSSGVPSDAVEFHEELAIITVVVFGVLLVYRWWAGAAWSARSKTIYLLIAAIGLGLLGATGFYGGDLVYRYGAGVVTTVKGAASPPQHF